MLTQVELEHLEIGQMLWHRGRAWEVRAIRTDSPPHSAIPGLTHTLRRTDQIVDFHFSSQQVRELFSWTPPQTEG